MDALGVAWEYEPRGFYFGDVFYLPDFFLPKSRQHLEIKAEWDHGARTKADALVAHAAARPFTGPEQPAIPLIVGEPGGRFRGYGAAGFLVDTVLLECLSCGGWWFAEEWAGWGCQCCGVSYGNDMIAGQHHSPIIPFPMSPRDVEELDG